MVQEQTQGNRIALIGTDCHGYCSDVTLFTCADIILVTLVN